ncbi:MAG: tetratricopeptide repeat protein [Candidatus Eisenbacteria bacterium]|nr:tetratricopeptide repeat protein [Candidatus Eisenbacteria bacterium]
MLVALVLARALLTFLPGMWAWSLNVQRFLPAPAAWTLWALAGLTLLPPLARVMVRWLERPAGLAGRRPTVAALLVFAGGAALVWSLPDRTHYVGDFLLRQGAVIAREPPGNVFIQATPLDLFLHYDLPCALVDRLNLQPDTAARLLGALEAGLLAWLASRFARVLRLEGAAHVAAASIVFFGAYLGLYAGYGKSFSELTLAVAAAGVFGLLAVREGRGLLAFGVALSCALLAHRLGLALWPAALVVWTLWLSRHRAAGGWRRAAAVAGIALPLCVLAWVLPGFTRVLGGYDMRVHLVSDQVKSQGGPLAAMWAGLRPLDLLNLVLAISPLALAAPLVMMGGAGARGRRAELLTLAVIALPYLAILLVAHPGQGIFRDWDDFGVLGVSLSLVTGWLVGGALGAQPRLRWVGIAVAAYVALASSQWLLLWTDADRGMRRAAAFVTEAPARQGRDAGRTWEFLGMRQRQLGRNEAAAAALARAARNAPSPAVMREWALAEAECGRLEEARRIYRELLERDPRNRSAWFSLGAISTQLGDYPESRRALRELLRIDPGNGQVRQLLAEIDRYHPASPAPAP